LAVRDRPRTQAATWRPFRALARRAGSDDGVALVEFALILPVLALMLFGMLDFGKAFNYWIDETHLANEGARWAAVNKNPASGASLQQYIRSQATTPELRNGGSASVANPVRVCIDFPDDLNSNGLADVGEPVRVTVTATYRWLGVITLKTGLTTTPITGASTMRLEGRPTMYAAGCA